MNWEPPTISIPEQEWLEAMRQSAYQIVDAFNIPPVIAGETSGNARAMDVVSLVNDLKAGQETPLWLCAVKTYSSIRYYAHLAKAYPHPTRKLRKCHIRKRYLQMRRERRRYL